MLSVTQATNLPALPKGLGVILEDYQRHCRQNGLRESSIALYAKVNTWFLHSVHANGCECAENISASHVAMACLALKSNYYLSAVKTFLRFLHSEEYTDKDYSDVVPDYKRPQPMPTVYTEDEIRRFEAAIFDKGNKRDYAAVLLATRLGIRSGDITRLVFDDVDFGKNTIHIIQQKTGGRVEFPLLPEIKSAMLDYIHSERPTSEIQNIFLVQKSPHKRLSITQMRDIVSRGLKRARIDTSEKSRGPHALRSSLASSMVNDNVPYEAVRKILGHIDPNAIKSYARLDLERLRIYAIKPPKPSGNFASFLAGRGGL